jgi:hypothetical protein
MTCPTKNKNNEAGFAIPDNIMRVRMASKWQGLHQDWLHAALKRSIYGRQSLEQFQ